MGSSTIHPLSLAVVTNTNALTTPAESAIVLRNNKDPSQFIEGFFPIGEFTPSDIIALFFFYLNTQECRHFSLTCKRVQVILYTHPALKNVCKNVKIYYSDCIKRLFQIHINNKESLTNSTITRFQSIQSKITFLDLSGRDYTWKIQPIPPFQHVSLSHIIHNLFTNVSTYPTNNIPIVTPEDILIDNQPDEENLIKRIAQIFSCIQELTLNETNAIGASLNHLTTMTSLTCLNIRNSHIESIPQLPYLKSLDLSNTFLDNDDSLNHLTTLEEIYLYEEHSDWGVLWMNEFNRFSHPHLGTSASSLIKPSLPLKSILLNPRNLSLQVLQGQTQLSTLAISSVVKAPTFTDDDFKQLGSLTTLQSLNLSFGDISPTTDNLQFLTKLPKLQSLIFGSTKSLPALPSCSNIQDIVLFNDAAGEEIIKSLSGMTGLKSLQILSGCINLSWFQNFVPPGNFKKLLLKGSECISSSITESSYTTAFSTLQHLRIDLSAFKGGIPPFLLHLDALRSAIIQVPIGPHQLERLVSGSHLQYLFIHLDNDDDEETVTALGAIPFIQSLHTLGIYIPPENLIEQLPSTPKKLIIVVPPWRALLFKDSLLFKKKLTQFQLERAKKGQEVTLFFQNSSYHVPFSDMEKLFTDI